METELKSLMNFTGIERENFRDLLATIGNTLMPFGRFGPKEFPPQELPVMDLPPKYLDLFQQHGFSNGRHSGVAGGGWAIKMAGLGRAFEPIRQARGLRRREG